MPVTLMHQSRIVITQWQRTQISKEKIPNLFIWKCSFHFVLSCFDCCLPPSFDRLPPYLVHWLHAGLFCLCLVQLSADFLFHIRCSGIHRERCRCCKKISKWTVALILGFPFLSDFPSALAGSRPGTGKRSFLFLWSWYKLVKKDGGSVDTAASNVYCDVPDSPDPPIIGVFHQHRLRMCHQHFWLHLLARIIHWAPAPLPSTVANHLSDGFWYSGWNCVQS